MLKKIKTLISMISRGEFGELRSKLLIKFGSRETVFTEIYKKNVWGSAETVSGAGSEARYTVNLIEKLPALLRKYSIHSVNDAPCGDFHVMQKIDLTGIRYSGFDIVKDMIDNNNEKYRNADRAFVHFDLVNEVLPTADLIISRDMFIHFSFSDTIKTIDQFKRSGSRYLLTNTYPGVKNNIDIKTGNWRPVNLLIEPYCLGRLLDFIEEYDSAEHGKKLLALFLINDSSEAE